MSIIPVSKILKEYGISKIKFYYKNCPIIGNIFTACLLVSDEKKIISRGVAICSILDGHRKQEGRKIALIRAKKAMFKKESGDKIKSDLLLGWKYRKSFKIKNEKMKYMLLKNLDYLGFPFEEKNFNDNIKRVDVFIPYNYPISVAGSLFKYKSEFQPTPTDDEKEMFKLSI